MIDGFDPTFDDRTGAEDWAEIPLLQVMPGVYPSFRIKRWGLEEVTMFEQVMRFARPLDVRGLLTGDGTMWMSDVPQERAMMLANARGSRGKTLVGGLGLGMYAQYAVPYVSSLHIVERDPNLIEVVGPLVEVAAAPLNVDVELLAGDVVVFLEQPATQRFDTIFLDTWHALDPLLLPHINRLRDLAADHLSEGGRIRLWGYAWIVDLFVDACRQVLEHEPEAREAVIREAESPEAAAMLRRAAQPFAGQRITDLGAALDACRKMAYTL